MQYYVLGPDGSKYGPADVETLRRWVAENRVSAHSTLEDFSTGQRLIASALPGLMAPDERPAYQPVGYSQPSANYPRAVSNPAAGSSELTASFLLTGLSFISCPVILPIIGLVFANKAMAFGNPSAGSARIFAIVVLVLQSVGVALYLALIIAMVTMGGFG